MRFLTIFLLLFSSLLADRDGGPYLGFGYGVSQYDDGNLNESVIENRSNSLVFYAGAYINKHLSVELGYTNFNASTNDSFIVKDDSIKNVTLSTITISTLAHYAFFKDKLDLYARFGAGEIDQNNIDNEGFSMLYGVGMGYRFNKYFDIKLAYDNYQIDYDEDDDKSTDYKMQLHLVYTAIEVQF